MKERKIIVRWVAIVLSFILVLWGGYVAYLCIITWNVRSEYETTTSKEFMEGKYKGDIAYGYDDLNGYGTVKHGNFDMIIKEMNRDSKFILLRIKGNAVKSYQKPKNLKVMSKDDEDFLLTFDLEYEIVIAIEYKDIEIVCNEVSGLVDLEYDKQNIKVISLQINNQKIDYNKSAIKYAKSFQENMNRNGVGTKISLEEAKLIVYTTEEKLALYNVMCDEIKAEFSTEQYYDIAANNADIFLSKLAYGFGIRLLRINGRVVDFSKLNQKQTELEMKIDKIKLDIMK